MDIPSLPNLPSLRSLIEGFEKLVSILLNAWLQFLASLATEGGHIFVWLLVLWFGVAIEKMGISFGHEISVAAATGLGIAIKDAARSQNAGA